MMFARRLISSFKKVVQKQTNIKPIHVNLRGIEVGRVVVRFPLEASGYLHIGHAKAALLNQYYQLAFEGKLIVRFDDTNPAKGNPHFEQVVKEDFRMLDIVPDQWTHSSDHFELLLSLCEKLLVEGKAYVDDTDFETLCNEKDAGIESKNRNNSPQKNLKLWEQMKQGTPKGQECRVRIKIDMESKNVTMRDPAIYRCQAEEHVRTANKYKVYPKYNFACPVIDSVEGVTHVLRITEYREPDDQYYFICNALGLRKPHFCRYDPLKIRNTLLSEHKLSILVNEKVVDGWDDPRMPTVRGLMRRGMTVEGLKQSILAQGESSSSMEWDIIWAVNKKVIEPVAPRFIVLEKPLGDAVEQPIVPVTICPTFDSELRPTLFNSRNPDIGIRQVWFSPRILIAQSDAAMIKEKDVVSFVQWGNMKVVEVQKKDGVVVKIIVDLDLDNKNFKKTLKVKWLADKPEALVPVKTIRYDHVTSKLDRSKDNNRREFVNVGSMVSFYTLSTSYKLKFWVQKHYVGEAALKTLKKGDIIELQQRKFFICDHPAKEDSPLVLIEIPDGAIGEYLKK